MSTKALRRLKWGLRGMLQERAPGLLFRLLGWRRWAHEPEMRLVGLFAARPGIALDVGANKGVYLNTMARHYRQVEAFEPSPELADYLRRAVPPHVIVNQYALSDRSGIALFSVPGDLNEQGSLEPGQPVEGHPFRSYEIHTRRLDDLDLPPVAFIKIDVEGHEFAMLQGGLATLRRDRPAILIEVEERHGAGNLARVPDLLGRMGYRGYFLDGGRLRPFAEFDLARDQNPAVIDDGVKTGRYINNFLFVADPRDEQIIASLKAA